MFEKEAEEESALGSQWPWESLCGQRWAGRGEAQGLGETDTGGREASGEGWGVASMDCAPRLRCQVDGAQAQWRAQLSLQ